MGKFAELCKGRTMGAFFLLLLSSRKTLSRMEEDQTTVAATIGYERTSLTRGSNYFALLRNRLPGRKPGRSGQLPTRSSHRSGRAPFGHPARQVTGSLRAARPRRMGTEADETGGKRTVAPNSTHRADAAGIAISATDRAPRSGTAARRPGSR